jgi:hypothetical protein
VPVTRRECEKCRLKALEPPNKPFRGLAGPFTGRIDPINRRIRSFILPKKPFNQQ